MVESTRPAMLRRAGLTVAEILDETHDTKTFRIAAPSGGLPAFLPGQFYALEVCAADGTWIRRSYSISSAPGETQYFDLTIKFLEGGAATAVLFQQIKPGSEVRATGPFGEFTLDTTKPAILVGGGVGVTPLMGMLRHIVRERLFTPVVLLYSNRERRDVIFETELEGMGRNHPHLKISQTLTRGDGTDPSRPHAEPWRGSLGRFRAEDVRRACAALRDPIVYLCGPVPFMEELGREFIQSGIPPANVRTEAFLGTSPKF